MKLREATFADVLPVWRDRLWPGRVSPIEPASSMLYLGGYDVAIKQRYIPRFFIVENNGSVVAVNSGHQTDSSDYRSRGIFVDPAYKKQGIGRLLLMAVEQAAREAACTRLWSLPRLSALGFYQQCGFVQQSPIITEDVEFGPNCFAAKELCSA